MFSLALDYISILCSFLIFHLCLFVSALSEYPLFIHSVICISCLFPLSIFSSFHSFLCRLFLNFQHNSVLSAITSFSLCLILLLSNIFHFYVTLPFHLNPNSNRSIFCFSYSNDSPVRCNSGERDCCCRCCSEGSTELKKWLSLMESLPKEFFQPRAFYWIWIKPILFQRWFPFFNAAAAADE